ncbi:MAG: NifU family protein [Bacteroidota bacterium]|nr:NifU family protein [Bacteroidota bacterium]
MTTEAIRLNVEKALEEIRPFLQGDGGDISLVEVGDDGKIVKVRLEGTCVSCSINQMTLKNGVEMTIKRYAPEVEQVINVE